MVFLKYGICMLRLSCKGLLSKTDGNESGDFGKCYKMALILYRWEFYLGI